MTTERGAAEATIDDHLRSLIRTMKRGARISLTDIPNDPTFLSSHFPGECAKAMAELIEHALYTDHIAALEAVKATVTSYDEIIEAAASAGDAAVYEAMRSTTFDPSIPDNVAEYVGNAIRAATVPSPALEANQPERTFEDGVKAAAALFEAEKDDQTSTVDKLIREAHRQRILLLVGPHLINRRPALEANQQVIETLRAALEQICDLRSYSMRDASENVDVMQQIARAALTPHTQDEHQMDALLQARDDQ